MLSVWARSNLPMAPAASLRRVALWVQRVASTLQDQPKIAPKWRLVAPIAAAPVTVLADAAG